MGRQRLSEALQQPFETLSQASQFALLRVMMHGYRKPFDRVYRSERPLCGARCRDGHSCQAPAMLDRETGCYIRNGRCRIHGGLSTGPRTVAGRRRVAAVARQRMLERWEAKRKQPEKT